jgi:hypothetical protein
LVGALIESLVLDLFEFPEEVRIVVFERFECDDVIVSGQISVKEVLDSKESICFLFQMVVFTGLSVRDQSYLLLFSSSTQILSGILVFE